MIFPIFSSSSSLASAKNYKHIHEIFLCIHFDMVDMVKHLKRKRRAVSIIIYTDNGYKLMYVSGFADGFAIDFVPGRFKFGLVSAQSYTRYTFSKSSKRLSSFLMLYFTNLSIQLRECKVSVLKSNVKFKELFPK